MFLLICGLIFGIAVGGSMVKREPPKVVNTVQYVDYQTYKKWGTHKLVPIGTRELPTAEQWDKTFNKPYTP